MKDWIGIQISIAYSARTNIHLTPNITKKSIHRLALVEYSNVTLCNPRILFKPIVNITFFGKYHTCLRNSPWCQANKIVNIDYVLILWVMLKIMNRIAAKSRRLIAPGSHPLCKEQVQTSFTKLKDSFVELKHDGTSSFFMFGDNFVTLFLNYL